MTGKQVGVSLQWTVIHGKNKQSIYICYNMGENIVLSGKNAKTKGIFLFIETHSIILFIGNINR